MGKTLQSNIIEFYKNCKTIHQIHQYYSTKSATKDSRICKILQADYHSPKEGMCFMNKKNRRPFQAMALMSGILSSLVGCILIGIFSGRALDKWIGTEPLFLIIGLMLGLAAGIYAMLRLVNQFFSGDN